MGAPAPTRTLGRGGHRRHPQSLDVLGRTRLAHDRLECGGTAYASRTCRRRSCTADGLDCGAQARESASDDRAFQASVVSARRLGPSRDHPARPSRRRRLLGRRRERGRARAHAARARPAPLTGPFLATPGRDACSRRSHHRDRQRTQRSHRVRGRVREGSRQRRRGGPRRRRARAASTSASHGRSQDERDRLVLTRRWLRRQLARQRLCHAADTTLVAATRRQGRLAALAVIRVPHAAAGRRHRSGTRTSVDSRPRGLRCAR